MTDPAPGTFSSGAAAPGLRRQGLADCRAALRDSLLGLAPVGQGGLGEALAPPGQVLAVDHDFSAWPLEEPAVLQALAAWLAAPGRRLVLIGVDFERSALRLPRFARWRRDRVHRIDSYRPLDGSLPEGLRGLIVGERGWQWLETRHLQLQGCTDRAQRQAWRVQIADFLQRCEPAWPVNPLGL